MTATQPLASETGPTLQDIRTWPATVDIPTANTALGISKSHGYALAQRGEYPVTVIKVSGRRYRVVTAAIVRLLEGAA